MDLGVRKDLMGRFPQGGIETNPIPTVEQPVVPAGLSVHPATVGVSPSILLIWVTEVLSERPMEVLVDLVLAGVAELVWGRTEGSN